METDGNDSLRVPQVENQNISWTQLNILKAIASGHGWERNIQRAVRVTADALRQQIEQLNFKGLIERTGLIQRGWRLTEAGVDLLGMSNMEPNIPQVNTQPPTQRNETRITTTFGTAFKVAFGAMLEIFSGLVVVGAISSLAYWTAYTFILRNCVPSQLLPYVPLDNPFVDIVLGMMTSVAFFLPLRNRLSSGLVGR